MGGEDRREFKEGKKKSTIKSTLHTNTYTLYKAHLHAAVDLVHRIDGSNGVKEHSAWLYLVPHVSQAHLQQANHLGHVPTHGAKFIQKPVSVLGGEVTQTITSSCINRQTDINNRKTTFLYLASGIYVSFPSN